MVAQKSSDAFQIRPSSLQYLDLSSAGRSTGKPVICFTSGVKPLEASNAPNSPQNVPVLASSPPTAEGASHPDAGNRFDGIAGSPPESFHPGSTIPSSSLSSAELLTAERTAKSGTFSRVTGFATSFTTQTQDTEVDDFGDIMVPLLETSFTSAARQACEVGGPEHPTWLFNAACETVLDTCELLEMIILHLPLLDLLQAERVSKTWQALSQCSPRIEKVLFRRQVPQSVLIRPSPANLACDGTAIKEEMPSSSWPHNEFRGPRQPILNPFLRRQLHARSNPDRITVRRSLFRKHEDPKIPYHIPEHLVEALFLHLEHDASWRGMLVTQPPISQLHFHCPFWSKGFDTQSKANLRVGDVRQAIDWHAWACGSRLQGLHKQVWEWKAMDVEVEIVDVGVSGWEMLRLLEVGAG